MNNGSSLIDQKLISKVQYKTYEKGEYDAEQPRSLTEVLDLIDQFPWDEQRPLADVQLSCPSVTILNDKNEYLKIGVYFNNKFTAYFLNDGHHLYERHLPTMADVHETVTTFFNNDLPMDQFERDYLTIGAIHHLETKIFEYRVKYVKLIFFSGLAFLYILIAVVMMFSHVLPGIGATVFFPAIIIIAFSFMLIKIGSEYYDCRNMYLQLSKGHNSFIFGTDEKSKVYYDKSDVKEVVITDEGRNGRARYQIIFNNGTIISFNNILIPLYDFVMKFPERIVARTNK